MSLTFEQRGQTWVCRETDAAWPVTLVARHVYYGTARLPTNLTLARGQGKASITILTGHVDLLIAAQRKSFAKEAGARLKTVTESKEEDLVTSIQTMVDALLERLVGAQDEIEITSVVDIAVPDDLTPRYVLWPIVPEARPGMLVAPSMSGKSSFALLAAYTVCTGYHFLDRLEARDEGPVMYVGQEETAEMFASRVTMIARGHQIAIPKHLYYLKLRGGSLIDSAELLAERAASYKAKLIIIDSAQATWGQGGDNVREYASRWFNAVEQLGVPTLVIEHPNLDGTRKPSVALEAAGTSVKRDRVGHSWTLKSLAIPPGPGQPYRYHTSLTDTKRNYVAKQDDIFYETQIYHHDWMRFVEASELSATTITESGSRLDTAMSSFMKEPDEEHSELGWTVTELRTRLKHSDDRRIRQALSAPHWRPADWNSDLVFQFGKVDGTGSNNVSNPLRYQLVIRRADEQPVQLSIPPGDDEEGYVLN